VELERSKSTDELVGFLMRHPVRFGALAILNQREASASEIARLTGESQQLVGNHIRALLKAKCIEEVRTARKRGAVEIFYRASLRPLITDAEWALMPEPTRREISGLAFGAVAAEVLNALRAGTFDSRTNRYLYWRGMDVDEEGWSELTAKVATFTEDVEQIAKRSAARIGESGEEAIPTVAAALTFERPRLA
jgi:DNA-binding transcriptional ArsR family regulator